MKKKFLLFILLLEGVFFSNVYAGQQITGEKVYNKKEIGSSHNINTEGWKSGIYIIKAAKGKESVEKKITIK